MKISEHAELRYLQKNRPKIVKPSEIAEICVKCPGSCKADKSLKVCGLKARFEKRKGNK